MASLRRWFAFSRWVRAGLGLAVLATLVAACSLLVDRGKDQCSTDQDCAAFGAHPFCQAGVCVESGLHPEGCFFGKPTQNDEFLNQCSPVACEKFDNCGRVGLCTSGAQPAPATAPPDAAPPTTTDASLIDAAPPLTPVDCIDGTHPVVVVAGSTAVQNFLSVVAPLLAPRQIVYLGSGSCNGVDNIFDPAKRVIKDIASRSALLFNSDGSSVNCTLGPSGATVDVGVSDVFEQSCNASYAAGGSIGEYRGPIQPMTFVVKAGSGEKAISAEMAHVVFGRGNTDLDKDPFRDPRKYPYTDPRLYFVRNASSGTQQMISRAIDVDPRRWWGVDRGGSPAVASALQLVPSDGVNAAIGILSTDFADAQRGPLHILAFQAKQQLCAYYPDSAANTVDKINVRDGHYSIWGPIHFYTPVSGGLPNTAAGELVLRFTADRLDPQLLDAVIKIGLVPSCAMKVQRKTEMGPLEAFSPPYQCGCYFETKITGKMPATCQTCTTGTECPSATPNCNEGFCEAGG